MFAHMNMAVARKAPSLLLTVGVALGLLSSAAVPRLAGQSSRPPGGFVARELTGDTWLNLPKGSQLSLASRKGKVTILHFWTFGCINCKRNLSAYARWQKRFASKGVVVIGVHTPETEGERNLTNVVRKVKELGISYPVLVDAEKQNWRRWEQAVWPAIYLIDKHGRVRYMWEGELEYQGAGGEAKMTRLIEDLLRE
jgi:thiol-disulfide isomerase/thioredoxin